LKKIIVVLLVVFCAAFAVAQNAPKAEVFGGYQYTNVDLKGITGRQSFNGWDADVAAHVTPNFSVVADFSGAYKTETIDLGGGVSVDGKLRLYNYLFGPRVSANAGKITPFAEALVGVGHASAGASIAGFGGSVGTNGFAMALGGGVDVNASPHFAVRAAKFDYLYNRISASAFGASASESLNNFRIATGIVFKF
jgi:hypothetical protein